MRTVRTELGLGVDVTAAKATASDVPSPEPRCVRRQRVATLSRATRRDGVDDGVEAAAVEHRALAAHRRGVDVEQPVDLGVARPAVAVPRPGADGHLRRRCRALRRQRDADEVARRDGR